MKNSILTVFAAMLFMSCTVASNFSNNIRKVGTKQKSIANTKWILLDQVKGTQPTLVIENNKISGNAGCNTFFGNLLLDTTAGNFTAKQIATTRMACEDMNTETNFIKMLSEADKYLVAESTLELYKGNLLLMKFKKQ